MGTRFVCTDECDASLQYKEAYLNCRQEDILIIPSPLGLPCASSAMRLSIDS